MTEHHHCQIVTLIKDQDTLLTADTLTHMDKVAHQQAVIDTLQCRESIVTLHHLVQLTLTTQCHMIVIQ